MPSTNAALALAGYTTAPSPSYGLKLVFKDGQPVGHFDCQTAWTLPGLKEAGALLDARLSVFDQVSDLAKRFGQPLSEHETDVARRLILVGATDPEAVLAEVRVVLSIP